MQVLAKRSLGKVTLKYRINGGRTHSASTKEWRGGEKYKPAAVHYRELRGTVRGADPGDEVTVWFEGDEGRKDYKSDSFTYELVSDTRNDVLVVAAEDYTGASPVQAGGPNYLDYYLDAIRGAGFEADVYDVDARGRTAPDHLGVLSHYDAVVWYTGDDIVTRPAGLTGGQRRPAGAGHDARVPRLHERARQRPLHRPVRGASSTPRRGRPARSSTTRRARARAVSVGRPTRPSTRGAASACSARRTATA